jgi:hypothetical protein
MVPNDIFIEVTANGSFTRESEYNCSKNKRISLLRNWPLKSDV